MSEFKIPAPDGIVLASLRADRLIHAIKSSVLDINGWEFMQSVLVDDLIISNPKFDLQKFTSEQSENFVSDGANIGMEQPNTITKDQVLPPPASVKKKIGARCLACGETLSFINVESGYCSACKFKDDK